MPAFAALGPALKMLASQGVKKAAMETAKGAVKDKAKNFVTGKGRKKKGKKGKGGALVKSEGGQEEESQEGGGAIVPTTPIVGKYRVETPPPKPDEVGKPSKISYEAINNQLDSIVALTGVLKKTSMSKMKTANNRRKAERKAEEKAKQRDRESLLERGAAGALGVAGNLYGQATKAFDPLKFFTMIFLGSLLTWIMTHGSKITAFLKTVLALMNNFGKLVKAGFNALKNVFKLAFKTIGKIASPLLKVGRALKNSIKSVGKNLSKAFSRVGKGLKNLAKGILNKIKAAGKLLLKPFSLLKGPEKDALKKNKGLNKLLGESKRIENAGTAPRKPGTLSNATKSMRLKHGDEAARMYQGLVDNGVKPSRAAQTVNKAIKSGKLTSAPLQGSLAGTKPGSQLLKGGVGRSTNRLIAKVGGKNALRATKALKSTLGRIPIIGPIITGIVSILSGDPPDQTLFKVGGAAIGGLLGTFIPIPVVGTLIGEIVGEYVGDLIYHLINGGKGDTPTAGKKLKDDWDEALKNMNFIGEGFGRLYEGLPKFKLPDLKWANPVAYGPLNLLLGATTGQKIQDIGIPNPFAMLNPFELVPMIHKAFFTEEDMEPGEVKQRGDKVNLNDPNRPAGVTNMSTVTTVKPERAGDFVVNSAGQLRVFDGMGYAGATPEQQKLYESGATNIDGTKAPVSTGSGGVYGSTHLKSYAMKNGITDPTELAMFMAQMSHESGSFRYAEEIHDGSDYEGSSILGNNQPGDGPRFKGRGYIQLTGRWNYGHYGKMVGVDLVNNPQLAADPDVAAAVAIAYYMDRVDRDAARKGDVKSVTYAINGGYNGLADRQKRFDQYMSGKTPEGDVKGSVSTPNIQPQTPMVDLPETYTTSGVTYDLATGLPISGHETQVTRQATEDNSDKLAAQDKSDSDTSVTSAPTPAQVTPPAQSQMSSGISGISKQLPYEETGGTTVVMAPGSNQGGGMMGGGRSAGTPVIMGSGDVVNTYYKSQLLGFLYKQG